MIIFKYSNKFIYLGSIILILFGINISIFSNPFNIESGILKFNLGERNYSFTGTQVYILNKGNKKRVVIALEDKIQQAEFYISANIPPVDTKKELYLSTLDNEITMVFKSRTGSFMVAPSVKYLDPDEYTNQMKHSKGYAHIPEWKQMNRKDRLASGKGIVRLKEMEGTQFYLHLIPILNQSGDEVVEMQGNFSGSIKWETSQSVTQTTINDGIFRAGVVK